MTVVCRDRQGLFTALNKATCDLAKRPAKAWYEHAFLVPWALTICSTVLCAGYVALRLIGALGYLGLVL